MRLPDPIANTTTEAYLAYKAGVLTEDQLKPSLYDPYLHFDAWLAYWAGLTITYPNDGIATGKNLFNPRNATLGYFYINNLNLILFRQHPVSVYMEISPNTTYTVTKPILNNNRFGIGTCAVMPSPGVTLTKSQSGNNTDHLTITSGENDKWLVIYFKQGSDTTPVNTIFSQIQVEEGSSATEYEPFQATPEMLTDEEALVAYLAGVTDTYPEDIKDPYDVRIVGYLKYLVSARWGRPEYPVTNEELYLSMMDAPVVPSGDPSSDIEIDGAAEAPFASLEVHGDTYQHTYSGVNLLPFLNFTNTWNGLTAECVNGVIKFTGKPGSSYYPDVRIYADGTISYRAYRSTASQIDSTKGFFTEANTNYKLSTTVKGTTPYSVTVGYETTASNVVLGETGNKTITINSTEKVNFVSISFSQNLDVDITIKIQLEKGDTVTPWQPYVGGTPSPSPDYPQTVNVVTGSQNVWVHGKNLFNKSATPTTKFNDNSLTVSELPTGVRLTSGATVSYSGVIYIIGKKEDYIGKTLTLTAHSQSSSTNNPRVYIGTCNSSGGSRTSKSTETGSSGEYDFSLSWEVADDDSNEYICIALYTTATVTITAGTYMDYTNVQLEIGSATSYEPYQGNNYTIDLGSTELCKIGDYQDYIYKSGDDWYVHKEVRHLQLAISDMDNSEDYPGWTGQTQFKADLGTSSGGQVYTDTSMITNIAGLVTTDSRSVTKNFNGTNATILFSKLYYGDSYTQTYWKSNYSSLVVNFYYGINILPSDPKITDSTLIDQLDAIVEGGSYNGKTYIKVTATDPNLPTLLKVEAYKYD